MKKLIVLLLIATLSLFVFAGCDGLTPSEGEGEGEGEGEVEAVTVEVDGMVALGGKNWVSCGNHDITVTFAAPVENVYAWISFCSGYYGSAKVINEEGDVVLFPNEDKTVWEGSGYFGCMNSVAEGRQEPIPIYMCSPCCASYVNVEAGECAAGVCVSFPVVVDCDVPYALIEIDNDDEACECGGCALTFDSTSEGTCTETECCGDDCSGLAGWSIAIYEDDPFDECCETPCEEPIYTCSGTACPIDCTTDCSLDEDEDYYVVVNLVDNVGNEVEYYAIVELDSACGITVTEYCANVDSSTGDTNCGYSCCDCTDWTVPIRDTDETIGFCYPDDNCCYN